MFGGLNVKPMREHKTLQLQHKVFSIQMIINNIKHYHWFFCYHPNLLQILRLIILSILYNLLLNTQRSNFYKSFQI